MKRPQKSLPETLMAFLAIITPVPDFESDLI
jgi:hypothetical protein